MPSRVQRRHGSNHTHRVLEEAGFDSEAVVAAAHIEEQGLHLRATATDDVDRTPSDLGPRHNGLSGAVRPSTSNPAFDSSGGYLVPHNLPLPGRHHAFLAHGLVVADRQPFGDPATRPAISRTLTFTHDAIVLGDRHDRSVLAEGGPQKAQRGPVDEGGAVNVRPSADLEPSTVDTVSLMASTARKLAAMSSISVQVIAIEGW